MLAELLEWAKRYEEAAAMFLRTDSRPNAVLRAAVCQVGAEQMEQAVRLLEGHARNDPQHAVAYLTKAAAIAKNTAQDEKHREILRRIVEVAPNSEEATEARRSLAEQD
jgi:tetratricopeptide (TPR) repeat protein